ncbi:MAG: type III pantothenate kinase [Balneola sp.]|nr:MAG: type III pantothenate kinase [Balneola sp.]
MMSNFDSSINESVLFVDIGNSAVKVAVKNQDNWKVHSYQYAEEAAHEINNRLHPVQKIVLSSVRESTRDVIMSEIQAHLVDELTVHDIPSEKLDYRTPKTLGMDRFLVCLGAHSVEKKAVLVIDAGTACTIDFMDEEGVFRGGVIMPGLNPLLTIFNHNAPALPEVSLKIPDLFPGKSTEESLQWGQVAFWVDGVKNQLNRFQSAFGEFDLFLSGGDVEAVHKLLGMNTRIEKDLIFRGMEMMLKG